MTEADKEEILNMATKAQRNLSSKKLRKYYTEEEWLELRDNSPSGKKLENQYEIPWANLKERMNEKGRFHKWTPEEDDFLRKNYMFLSDRIIGMALNMPAAVVRQRRYQKDLVKHYTTPLEVIVWCKRDSFEEDVKNLNLTKARPEMRDAVTQLHQKGE